MSRLGLSEYKYDQSRSVFVAQQCNENLFFHYAESSTSIPQGPLFYFFDCALGFLGVDNYLTLISIEILITQFSIFLSFILFRKYIDEKLLAFALCCYLINPYLVVASRNSSTHFHQELFLLIFFYYLFKRNENKRSSFILGFVFALTFSTYYLLFLFLGTLLLLFLITKNLNYFLNIVYGGLIGFIINIFLYLPLVSGLEKLTFLANNSSWGVSSYWRILLDFLSGKSILTKINNPNDYQKLTEEFEYFNYLININYFLTISLIIFAIFKLRESRLDEIALIGINIFLFFGITVTVSNVALYHHYFFSIFIFGYLIIFQITNNLKIVKMFTIIFCINNLIIFSSFINHVNVNNGIQNSDYGKTYESCGCCVFDAKTCRGQ